MHEQHACCLLTGCWLLSPYSLCCCCLPFPPHCRLPWQCASQILKLHVALPLLLHLVLPVPQVCNHRFHNECLRQWGDTSCPVCRYCQHSAVTTSHCAICNTSAGGLTVSLSLVCAAPCSLQPWSTARAVQSLPGRQSCWLLPCLKRLPLCRPLAPTPTPTPTCRPVDLPDLRARGVRPLPGLPRRGALAGERARLRAGAGDAGRRICSLFVLRREEWRDSARPGAGHTGCGRQCLPACPLRPPVADHSLFALPCSVCGTM